MPRILYVGANCPCGPSYGGQLRTLHIARILKQCGDFGMVLVPYDVIDSATRQRVCNEFDLRAVLYPEKRRPGSISARLLREIDPYCADTQGFSIGADSLAMMHKIACEYDMIWFHGISIPNSLGRKYWPCSVLDIDDIPSQVFSGFAKKGGSVVSRIKAARHALLWRRRERVLRERFDIVSVCSERDKCYLGGGREIHTIPNGFVAPETIPVRSPASPPRIGFIGTMQYEPNVDGVRWFIRQVWPLIKAVRKDARLRLVGMGSDSGIAAEGQDIDGLGFVEDATSEIASWATSIVPINVGGGTRIKIAEAFSRKCPVVSTSLGAYGYQIQNGHECLLANSPTDFARACISLLDSHALGNELADRAWTRFCAEWSWDAIAPLVSSAVEACLNRSKYRAS